MTDAAPAIFLALEQSGFGAAIRQSRWLYPAANRPYRLVGTFAGAVAVMDIRLLGAGRDQAPTVLAGRSVAIAALAGMAVTGSCCSRRRPATLCLNPCSN